MAGKGEGRIRSRQPDKGTHLIECILYDNIRKGEKAKSEEEWEKKEGRFYDTIDFVDCATNIPPHLHKLKNSRFEWIDSFHSKPNILSVLVEQCSRKKVDKEQVIDDANFWA